MSTTTLDEGLAEIQALIPGARELTEQGRRYIYLPTLTLPGSGDSREALLCLSEHSGYATRLFLSAKVEGKGENWTIHQILDRPWHSWSWRDVTANRRPIEVLANHLRALR